MTKEFLYRQIADTLTMKIVSGVLSLGAPLPPVSALRREFGVSHITILRALELLSHRGAIIKHPRHACTVSTHFIDKQRKVRFIGGLFRHFNIRGAESYFNDLISGARREAAGAGYGLLLPPRSTALRYMPSASDLSEVLDEANAIAPQVAGFLLDSLIDDETANRIMTETGKRIVILDRDSTLPVDRVMADARDATRRIIQFLRKLSYEAFICCEVEHDWKETARKTVFDELELESPVLRLKKFRDVSRAEISRLIISGIQSFGDRRTAVLAPSDGEAAMVIDAIHQAGLSIPQFAGVVGFIGNFPRVTMPYKLTTMQISAEVLGEAAVSHLLRVNGYSQPATTLIPMEFILGETT